MAWSREVVFSGIKLSFESSCGIGGMLSKTGEVIGFFGRDEETIQMIRSRDQRILDVLNKALDDLDDISIASWATDGFWWRCAHGEDNQKFIDRLKRLKRSKYATRKQKDQAQTYIELELEIIRRANAQQSKSELCKKRRSEFSKKRDLLALSLIERDGFCCQKCGALNDLTIDHIKPISKGGSDNLDNLQWLCRRCNSKKGDREE